jgi:hypothetical protein
MDSFRADLNSIFYDTINQSQNGYYSKKNETVLLEIVEKNACLSKMMKE